VEALRHVRHLICGLAKSRSFTGTAFLTLASYLPARTAANVDPAEALAAE
jgi:hypothetical protein